MASIRCANGHTHTSVADVRACAQGGGVAVATKLTPMQEGALLKLGRNRATVPVQTSNYPTLAQQEAIGKMVSNKELTNEDLAVLELAVSRAKTNGDVQGIFEFLRERPWKKEATATPTLPVQAPTKSEGKKGGTTINKFGVRDGYYAVVLQDKERLFRVKSTSKGFVRLSVKSSDEWYPLTNWAKVQEVMRLIKIDQEAASLLYAELDRRCRRCGRELTDVDNPYFESGLGPDCGEKW